MALLLGIDLGTSYFKAALFDERGTLKGLGRVAVEKAIPAPGRVELGVELFWTLLRQAVQAALQQAGAKAQAITGLSYSSQASTFLLLDQRDRPLTPLISWLDTRGEGLEPPLLEFSRTQRFWETVGYRGVSSQTAVCKWRWYQRAEPALWARARSVMTISDYFSFALTEERVGDAGTASFLGVYDLPRGGWWPAALSAFEIDPQKLSTPLSPGSPVGRTAVGAMEKLGLPPGISFAVGSLDHHVGAIGAGLGRLAEVSITTGTVLAALALVDAVKAKPECFYGPHVGEADKRKRFYCLAFDPRGAGRLEEYQRAHAPSRSVEELLGLAAGDRRAMSTEGKAVREILEEIALAHRGLVQTVEGRDWRDPRDFRPSGEVRSAAARSAGELGPILATGGGARSRLWLEIKAKTLGRRLVTSRSPEPGCLGAAMFAAVAAGQYRTISDAQEAMTEAGEGVEPAAEG